MVELQPSKLIARVRFPPPAPFFRSLNFFVLNKKIIPAYIAQSVEHFLGKEEVTGSIPVVSTSFKAYDNKIFYAAPTLRGIH